VVIVRRRWWLLSTVCIVSLAAVPLSLSIPIHYRSEARIFIENPQVPERYVVPNNKVNAVQVVEAMTHEILSRTRLLQIIDEFGLYSKEKQRMSPDELVALMRDRIEVKPLTKDPEKREVNAFVIAFTGDNPHVAQEVTRRLTSRFIEENLQAQQDQDTTTTTFLENELERAKGELEAQEQLLKDFKIQNVGQLPEQQQGNLEVLSGLQMDLQNTQASLARAREQRTYLESMLSQFGSSSGAGDPDLHAANSSPAEDLRSEVQRLRAERDDLLSRFSPLYPDVVSLNQRIATEEKRLRQLVTTTPTPYATTSKSGTAAKSGSMQAGAIQLNSQLEANALEIADTEKEIATIKNKIATYEHRLSLAPVREQQLAEVLRNYDLSKQNYADLLSKKTQSQLATDLAKKQEGGQFRVIDQPSLPLKPADAQREKVCLGSLAGALVLGVVLALWMESRDHSLRREREVRAHFAVPLVVGIPTLLTKSGRRRLAWRLAFEWVAGSALVLTVLAAHSYVVWKSL
jgi:polysaccharide chain length determinant protein (PEP-CTERM system associated)